MRAALNNMGVANRALEDVMDKVRNKHYQVIVCYQNLLTCFHFHALLFLVRVISLRFVMQLACTLTFEAVHGASCDQGINHPNQYYSDSKTILESRVINSWTSLICLVWTYADFYA